MGHTKIDIYMFQVPRRASRRHPKSPGIRRPPHGSSLHVVASAMDEWQPTTGEAARCSWPQSCQEGPGQHHQQHLHSLLNFSPAQGTQCPQPHDHKGWRWPQGQGRVGDRAALGAQCTGFCLFYPLKLPLVQPWCGKGFPTNSLSPTASFTCCHQHMCSLSQITSVCAAAWLFLALFSPCLLQTSPVPFFFFTFPSRLSMLRVNCVGLKRNLLQRHVEASAGTDMAPFTVTFGDLVCRF